MSVKIISFSVNIIFTAPGLLPQTPADAPPLEGFNKKSPAAYGVDFYITSSKIFANFAFYK
jgi:hypothetical protein